VIDQSNIDEIIQRQKSPQEAYKWYKPQIDKLLDGYEGRLKPLQDAR
jgi:ribose transport system substrate-binding protein